MPANTLSSEPLTAGGPALIAWGVAARALPGQSVSGDLHLVKNITDGVLLAVVDGLGHGEEAAVAARCALAVLDRHAEESPAALVRRCHEGLTGTRGVVMTLASLQSSKNELAWLGVGNVEAFLLRARASAKGAPDRPMLHGGVVGYQLPQMHASTLPIAPEDLLIFVTDGIGAGFTEGLARTESPQTIAEGILEKHFKGRDDALVLVVRYLGKHSE